MIRIAISGASGRMGANLIQSCDNAANTQLTVALERPGSPAEGNDAGVQAGIAAQHVPIQCSMETTADAFDVLVDFTRPEATLDKLAFCVEHGKAMVIGTTGFTESQKAQIAAAAQQIPVVFAPNMSVGVNVTFKLLELAARAIGETSDIEIIEAHHRNKVDAPSGTALGMGEVIASTLDWNLKDCAVYAREGITGARESNTIGFSTIRGGDIVGDHTVLFAADGERVEISHKASSRQTFSNGAIRAAQWLAGKPAGLYDMQDVLGLRD